MNAMKNSQIIAKNLYYHSDGTELVKDEILISSKTMVVVLKSFLIKLLLKVNTFYFSQINILIEKPGPFIYGKPRPQTAIADSRIKHYLSDGTGRDSYITWTDGGLSSFYSCNTKNVDTYFNNNLRNYQRIPMSTQQDFYSMAQRLKSKEEFYKQSKLVKPQRQLTLRLSQPKQQLFLCPKDKSKRVNFNVVGKSMPLIEQNYCSRHQEV